MELNIKFNEKMLFETANRVLDEYEYNGKTIREWADLIANPKTNADRIRAMTDEELAEYHAEKCGCPHDPIIFGCKMATIGCIGCWLDWLREEVNE